MTKEKKRTRGRPQKGQLNSTRNIAKQMIRYDASHSAVHRLPDQVKDMIKNINNINPQRIVVYLGAGASAAHPANLPVYRGLNGIRQFIDPLHDPWYLPQSSADWEAFYTHLSSINLWKLVNDARPTDTHHFVTHLASTGRLQCVLTSNIDGLEHMAMIQGGVNPTTFVKEAHGRLHEHRCSNTLNCNNPINNCTNFVSYMDRKVQQHMNKKKEVFMPKCQHCSSIVRPNIVFYGECPNAKLIQKVEEAVKSCDLLLCFGTSLSVKPLLDIAKKKLRKRMVESTGKSGKILKTKKTIYVPCYCIDNGETTFEQTENQKKIHLTCDDFSKIVKPLFRSLQKKTKKQH